MSNQWLSAFLPPKAFPLTQQSIQHYNGPEDLHGLTLRHFHNFRSIQFLFIYLIPAA